MDDEINMKVRDQYDIQLVNRKGKIYLRAIPKTTFQPTEAQIKARLRFAELASMVKGMKGIDPIAKRPRASVTVELMRGTKFTPHVEKHTVLEERLKAWLKAYFASLTDEERELFLQKVKAYLKK
jgi:predicted GNAT family acetyltransferase